MSSGCTRIIVKNLPKDVDESQLRKLLSQKKCTITDLKLARTPQGKSRCFAFIGFENAEETREIIKYFNNTFIGTIRITVEPMSPSKKPNSTENPPKESIDDKRHRLLSIFSKEDEKDPLLQSFLAAMKSRSKGTTWSNDDEIPAVSPSLSDDEYEHWDATCKDKKDKSEKEIENEKVNKGEAGEDREYKTNEIAREKIMDTGRLFLRSLPFTCKSNDLEKLFSAFGPISDVLLPLTIDTHRSKGYGFIQFVLPEHALAAYEALRHDTFFQGRKLWIGPAMEHPESHQGNRASFKQMKLEKGKKSTIQGKEPERRLYSLFLSPDTVMDAISAHLEIPKRTLLIDPDAASKMAIAETFVIEQTKAFLYQHNIADISISENEEEKSNTIILIKNIPFVDEEALKSFIDKIGGVVSSGLIRLLMPPTKTIAIGEWTNEDAAREAFRALAYRRFRSAPLYVQWAPIGMLPESNAESHPIITAEKKKDDVITRESKEDSAAFSLFVKNINFNTTSEELLSAIKAVLDPLNIPTASACVSFRRDLKKGLLSAGYGFVSFSSHSLAVEALETLQSPLVIDGHRLQFSLSAEKHSEVRTNTVDSEHGTTILVKNVAFEATSSDLRKLFSAFGQVKRIRLPKKPSKGHRGFAFVEFITRSDAEEALNALRHTHLYGRHLVLQWAATDENEIESRLRVSLEKQASSFVKISSRHSRIDAIAESSENEEDDNDDDDEEIII